MENGGDLILFLGRWHPLVVHLPIGILVVSFVMAWFGRRQDTSGLRPAVSFTLLLGGISAVLASALGLLLASYGGYDMRTLGFHQWFGIATAVLSMAVWWLYRGATEQRPAMKRMVAWRLPIFSALMVLLCVTGHYGGSLTHGEGYLTEAMPPALAKVFGVEHEPETLVFENVQAAPVYDGLIQPILATRCQSCHGERKQEGGLALHQWSSLSTGGDGGKVLTPGQLEDSELYRRLVLPVGDDERMPPKGRTPITDDEIALIGWWIEQGAPTEGLVADLEQPEEIAAALAALEAGSAEPELPEAPPLDGDAVQQLVDRGVKVMPVAEGSNYLMISAINAPDFNDADAELLVTLKDNILQLQLGRTAITDAGLTHIGTLTMLQRLHLEHTQVTDAGLASLATCEKLQYLNLSSTDVGNEGVGRLKTLPALTHVYLFGTRVTGDGVAEMQQSQSEVVIDTGGYALPAS